MRKLMKTIRIGPDALVSFLPFGGIYLEQHWSGRIQAMSLPIEATERLRGLLNQRARRFSFPDTFAMLRAMAGRHERNVRHIKVKLEGGEVVEKTFDKPVSIWRALAEADAKKS